MICQLIHLIFLVPVLIISVKYGFNTLTVSRSLIRIQLILTALIIMKILYKFRFIDIIKNVIPMLVSSAVMGAVGYFLKGITANILWQFVVVFICVIVYFSTLIVFPSIRADVKEMLSKRREKEKTPKG